jgi:hypothetical protein
MNFWNNMPSYTLKNGLNEKYNLPIAPLDNLYDSGSNDSKGTNINYGKNTTNSANTKNLVNYHMKNKYLKYKNKYLKLKALLN